MFNVYVVHKNCQLVLVLLLCGYGVGYIL